MHEETVYNISAERCKEEPIEIPLFAHEREATDGFPIEVSHNGRTWLISPSDWEWEVVSKKQKTVMEREGMKPGVFVTTQRIFRRKRTPAGDLIKSRKNHITCSTTAAAWMLNTRHNGRTFGLLVPARTIEREIRTRIEEEKAELETLQKAAQRDLREVNAARETARAELARMREELDEMKRQLVAQAQEGQPPVKRQKAG